MAKYANLADCDDELITPTEEHLRQADIRVEMALHRIGVRPDELLLPQDVLTQLAVAHALALAGLKGSAGEATEMLARSKAFATMAKDLESALTREAIGAAETALSGAGLGSIEIGRG